MSPDETSADAARPHATRTDDARPDLSARDWHRAGEAHVAAYRRAIAAVRGRRA